MADRLMANSTAHPCGCRLWTGTMTADGYGRLGIWDKVKKKRTTVFAHRVAYVVFVGPIPDKHDIDHIPHLCPHRNCIEPTHLRPKPYREHRLTTGWSRRYGIPSGKENGQKFR